MEGKRPPLGRSSPSNGLRLFSTLLIFHGLTSGVSSNHVMVPEQVTAVLRKNITLPCKIEVGSNLSLTQSSWERRLPSGKITLAVFNPEYGISILPEHAKRISFVSPSVRDATITIEGVDFADAGSYTCKVATFPLGNAQASTYVNVIVEPKVYVSAGSAALLHGGNESLVATCIAEQGRPAAEVFWEPELMGRIERQVLDDVNGTTTVQAHYMWQPQSLAHGKTLTCVVRHPALLTEFRIPYTLNVQFAPVVSVMGIHRHWYVGQSNVKLICGAKANPPARHFAWVRLDGLMSEGVEVINNTLSFTRPLERNDSAAYRCEVTNDISVGTKDVYIWVQDPLPTTAAPVTTTPLLHDVATDTAADKQKASLTSPTLASLVDSSLATIIGGVVGGILFLVLLLILGGVCLMRKRRTFRGDYYIKQYLGPSDMQKESQLDVLQPHELQEVYGDKTSKGSQELKPKLGGDIIYPDYTPEHKDRDNWADRGENHRGLSEGDYCYQDHYNAQNMHPCGPPVHSTVVNNGSPYLPEDCYDNGTDSDYVSHMDGSVISRREWYV